MKERKSIKNYLNAIRAAKVNIQKFSVDQKAQVTHRFNLNKSVDRNMSYVKIKKSRRDPVEHLPQEQKQAPKFSTKSPYHAEIFSMKGVKRIRPQQHLPVHHQKSKALFNMFSRNRNKDSMQRFIQRAAKSTERPIRK